MEGAEDNRQEKTSVFQKAKAKARKMKDTIKMKTGHGQDLDNTNQNDQGHEEEEDEQMVDDSEVHDTVPKYESPAVTSTVAGQKKPDDKLGKPATAAEDQYGSKYTDAQTRPSSQWPDENTDNRGVDAARPTGMGTAGVQVPKNRDGLFSSSGALGVQGSESAGNFVHGDGGHMGDPKISLETPAAMEEDPYKPDYQSQVADPTGAGGEEAGINSIMKSFNKLNVDDGEPESKPISERAPETYTESQDHFSQEPILPTSTINPDDPGSISKSFDGDKPEDAPLDNVTNLPSNQSSYAQKIPYADKAIAAKNVVASKLGYGSTEDPTASPKATQGGEEIGKPGTTTDYGQKIVAPETFSKVNADDGEPESKPISERAPETYTESQDHFSQEPIPPTSTINSDHPGSISKSFDGDKPADAPLDNVTNLPSSQSSYAQKIPYADKAIAAKNVVASKLGYGSTKDPTASPKATQGGEEIGKPGTTTEYGQKIVAPESFNKVNADDGEPESKPISERAPETYTESQDHFSPEPIPPTSTINPDDPGSISKSFDGDKPEDTPLDNVTNPPPNQSSYTEKISYATSAITDTAIAAKNVVASKLGYGSTVDPTASPKATQGGEEIGKPGTTTVYEKVSNAGSPVVTPLYGKVSNVGSSVVSKVRGTGTKQDQGVEGQDQGDEGQDQGVPVKGYLAEKLRPSDDDKALSEVISDTLHNRKQEVDGEEEGENQKPAVGTVTESEEVRERLGSDEGNRGMTETESKAAPNVSPTGKGMVESVKGTVTSWFSRGGDQKQTSEASPGTIPEEERLSSSTGEEAVGHGQIGVGEPGEGRLQESGK